MAKIREYNSQQTPNAPINRTYSGEDFGAQGGRALSNFGKSLGQAATVAGEIYDKNKAQEDTANIQKELAKLQAKASEEFAKGSSQEHPEGTNFSENFTQYLEKESSKISENITTDEGLQYYRKAKFNLESHYQKQAIKIDADRKGQKAKNDYAEGRNSLTSANVSNPKGFDVSLKSHNEMVDGLISSGRVPPAVGEKLRLEGNSELAESAIKGQIRISPKDARAQINSGKWDQYIAGDKKYQLLEAADSEENSRRVESERVMNLTEKINKEKIKKTQTDFANRLSDMTLTIKDIQDSDLPEFGTGSKASFKAAAARQAKNGDMATNPVIFNKLLDRIHADPEYDSTAITDENVINDFRYGNGVSEADGDLLRREVRALKAGNIKAKAKQNIILDARKSLSQTNMLSGYMDEVGEKKTHEFSSFIHKKINDAEDKGEPIEDLLNPNSPKYVGQYKAMFVKSEKEVMKEMADKKKIKPLINGFNKEQKAAYEWALKNKSDKRAAGIMKKLGMSEE